MRCILLIHIFCFCWILSSGQNLKHIASIQKKADSLVASFWGQSNFNKCIQLDKTRSRYLVLGKMWEKECLFNSRLTFSPNTFLYRYKVIHPVFHGDTAQIEFYLDNSGKLIFNSIGLLKCGNLDSLKTLTKKQAIQKAKEYGLKSEECSVSLSWQESFIDKDPSTQGNFTWKVKAALEQSHREGCSFYNKQAYAIDIFTGKLISISEFGEK